MLNNAHLDVAPPVAALRSRALGEVDLLGRVGSVEVILFVDGATVAVERNPGERARRILHLSLV